MPGSCPRTPSAPSPSRREPHQRQRCPFGRRHPSLRAAPGAMYWNVPKMEPFSVRGFSSVGSADSTEDVSAETSVRNLASPKSSSFAPDLVSMMLPGFRSRCTTPCRWALSSASAISMAWRSAWSRGRAPFFSRSASDSPSMYSMTRSRCRLVRPRRESVQMWGWFRLETARASRSKRCLSSGLSDEVGRRTLRRQCGRAGYLWPCRPHPSPPHQSRKDLVGAELCAFS